MQKKIFNIKYTTVIMILLSLLSVTSCKKFVENGTPPSSLTESNVFVDSATATSAVLALYSRIANGNPQNNTLLFNTNRYGSMSADEGYYLTTSTYDNFKNNTLAAGNAAYGGLWFDAYQNIGRANYCISGLQASTALSATAKNQLLGEAKFMRAWCYYNLANYFGDVPLVLTTDALTTSLLPRAPVAQVYQQVVNDLTDAKGLLTTTYPSIERARINQRVVSAFLARVYFYQQNWASAEAEATSVIGTGVYSLEPVLNNVFIKTSNEIIWQIASSTGVTSMGPDFVPASTTPSFVLYDTLAKTFEVGDKRLANWAKSIVYSGKTYYYPYKYKLRTGTTGNEYPVMLRLGELYLIRAEARAQQTNIAGAQADLNIIRSRAGLANTTATTQPQLLTALEHERWVELFTENGDRWFNLKRINKADAVLGLIKPLWQPFQKLYPIPNADRAANPNLTDNPGY